MSNSKIKTNLDYVDLIKVYTDKSSGLRLTYQDGIQYKMLQNQDGKSFYFSSTDILEVLQRVDSDQNPFLQLNFKNNQKILLTDSWVGFKPYPILGLDLARLPKVVTTPDLQSVFDAIGESLSSSQETDQEVDILKKVYQSILLGAEKVGFQLPFERRWMLSLSATRLRASA